MPAWPSATAYPRLRWAGASAPGELFRQYERGGAFDEMFEPGGGPRPHCRRLLEALHAASPADLRQSQREAEKGDDPSVYPSNVCRQCALVTYPIESVLPA